MRANGIHGSSSVSFLQYGDSGIRPDGDKTVFSLQEKICFSCTEVDEKKTGTISFCPLVNCWCNSAFRKEKSLERGVSIFWGGKKPTSFRDDRHWSSHT